MKKIVENLDELAQDILQIGSYLSFNGEIALVVNPDSSTECFTLMDYSGRIDIFDVGSSEYMVLCPKLPPANGVAFSLKLRIGRQWEKTGQCDKNNRLYIKAQLQSIEYNRMLIEARLYINK